MSNQTITPADVDAALLRIHCCNATRGCRKPSAPRVTWWKGAYASQLTHLLEIAIHVVLNSTAISTGKFSIVPFEQDRVRPQRYLDTQRCRTHPYPGLASTCFYEPPAAACARFSPSSQRYVSTPAEQFAAGAVLRSAHPYHVASATARLLFTPNAWLHERVALVSQAVSDAIVEGLWTHGQSLDAIMKGRPPATTVELVFGIVKRGATADASIGTFLWVLRIVGLFELVLELTFALLGVARWLRCRFAKDSKLSL